MLSPKGVTLWEVRGGGRGGGCINFGLQCNQWYDLSPVFWVPSNHGMCLVYYKLLKR